MEEIIFKILIATSFCKRTHRNWLTHNAYKFVLSAWFCAYSHLQETELSISKVLKKFQLVSTEVSKQSETMQRSFAEGKELFFFLTFSFVPGYRGLTSNVDGLR